MVGYLENAIEDVVGGAIKRSFVGGSQIMGYFCFVKIENRQTRLDSMLGVLESGEAIVCVWMGEVTWLVINPGQVLKTFLYHVWVGMWISGMLLSIMGIGLKGQSIVG